MCIADFKIGGNNLNAKNHSEFLNAIRSVKFNLK